MSTAKMRARFSASRSQPRRWASCGGGLRNPPRGQSYAGGVIHGLEIPYVFNSLASLGDETDRGIAADMLRRSTNMARFGDPDGKPDAGAELTPGWPRYRRELDQHLEFADRIRIGTGLDQEAGDLIDTARSRIRN